MVANPNAFKDAESTNDSTRNAQVFTDINLNMVRHPVTGDIAKLSNVEAVKASVRNLINTNKGERPFHPEIGSNVTALLFEPADAFTANAIKEEIIYVIKKYEPRTNGHTVEVSDNSDRNAYEVTIGFNMIYSPNREEITFYLQRLR